MASTARIDELKKKFDENPRRYFAPLANEFRKSGDIEQAIMICEEFLPQQPGHMSGHIVYGQALYEAGRLPESRGVFETALGLDPENLIALRHLGDIARGQHDPAAARGWYVRVLDADPRNEEIQALIAGLDSDDGTAPLLDMPGDPQASAPSSLGMEIEKEAVPFDQMPTREVVARPFEPAPAREVTETPFDQMPTREVVARPFIDPSLADTAPAGLPVIPAKPIAPAAEAPELLDGFSLSGFGNAADGADDSRTSSHAEGFESTEFAPPTEHVPAAELDASLDSGVPSFSSPEHVIETLDGLEGSGGQPHGSGAEHRASVADLEPLDLEGGLLLPPEPPAPEFAATAPSFDEPAPAEELLDFDLSESGVSGDHVETTDAERPELDDAVAGTAVPEELIPAELPPEVIAAEAEMISAGESPPPPETDEAEAPVAPRPPFVTETMAELYLAQGFREQALAVYSDLLAASPDDERLSGIVGSLTPAAEAEDTGPNVRDFFARIANRRPGTVAASYEPPSDDDFAPTDGLMSAPEVASEPEQYDAPEEPAMVSAPTDVPSAIERAAATQQPDGSIDALFGNRSAGTTEDSAAAALAQAFGGGADIVAPPPILGRPAHAAKGELSLDSVFRDGPARPARSSQSFSFDQFFAGAEDRPARPSPSRGVATPVDSPASPAERGADDIEQFNSWLQGLKQR